MASSPSKPNEQQQSPELRYARLRLAYAKEFNGAVAPPTRLVKCITDKKLFYESEIETLLRLTEERRALIKQHDPMETNPVVTEYIDAQQEYSKCYGRPSPWRQNALQSGSLEGMMAHFLRVDKTYTRETQMLREDISAYREMNSIVEGVPTWLGDFERWPYRLPRRHGRAISVHRFNLGNPEWKLEENDSVRILPPTPKIPRSYLTRSETEDAWDRLDASWQQYRPTNSDTG